MHHQPWRKTEVRHQAQSISHPSIEFPSHLSSDAIWLWRWNQYEDSLPRCSPESRVSCICSFETRNWLIQGRSHISSCPCHSCQTPFSSRFGLVLLRASHTHWHFHYLEKKKYKSMKEIDISFLNFFKYMTYHYVVYQVRGLLL